MSKKEKPTYHASHEAPKSPESNTPKKNSRSGSHLKKRRVRYDRIAVVVVPLLLIVVVIVVFCLHSCSKNNGTSDSSSTATTPAATTTSEKNNDSTEPDVATDTTELTDGKEITLTANGVKEGNLIVINEDHVYTFPNGDPKLANVYEEHNDSYSVGDMEVQLDKEALTHLNEMMAGFEEETGFRNLQVFSGYRTQEDQEERYDNGSTNFRGGYSDYHSGRSFNIRILFDSASSDYYNAEKYPDYSWISEHAAEYGFVVRYPDGKDSITGEESRTYTFRYVGIPHAVYMTEHKLCLEEYVDEIKNYTAEEPLEITVDDVTYSVFYVSVGGTNNVTVTIPSSDYTASGDNVGGYIIACQ